MESFRDDNLRFYVIVFRFKGEIWIRAKDICLFLSYKDYKRAVQKHVNREDKKRPKLQDKRYRCFFLNKSGVYSLVNKSRETKVKYQFIEWLEDKVYNLNNKKSNLSIKKIMKHHISLKQIHINPEITRERQKTNCLRKIKKSLKKQLKKHWKMQKLVIMDYLIILKRMTG